MNSVPKRQIEKAQMRRFQRQGSNVMESNSKQANVASDRVSRQLLVSLRELPLTEQQIDSLVQSLEGFVVEELGRLHLSNVAVTDLADELRTRGVPRLGNNTAGLVVNHASES